MNDIIHNIKLPRMRTIAEAYEEIKIIDNHTALSKYHIRQLALTGVLPTVHAGKKILINLDLLIEYLNNPNDNKFMKVKTENNIRKIGDKNYDNKR